MARIHRIKVTTEVALLAAAVAIVAIGALTTIPEFAPKLMARHVPAGPIETVPAAPAPQALARAPSADPETVGGIKDLGLRR